jgi:hypothetical protein
MVDRGKMSDRVKSRTGDSAMGTGARAKSKTAKGGGPEFGALAHEVDSAGQRDFVSAAGTVADRYEVQADERVADDAQRVLAAMPGK